MKGRACKSNTDLQPVTLSKILPSLDWEGGLPNIFEQHRYLSGDAPQPERALDGRTYVQGQPFISLEEGGACCPLPDVPSSEHQLHGLLEMLQEKEPKHTDLRSAIRHEVGNLMAALKKEKKFPLPPE